MEWSQAKLACRKEYENRNAALRKKREEEEYMETDKKTKKIRMEKIDVVCNMYVLTDTVSIAGG
jgi:hypothetical protein